MDAAGGWKTEMWKTEIWGMEDRIAGHRTQLRFQGAGANPWELERRNGLVRGIFYRLIAHDRFSDKQIPSGVQWRVNALIPAGGNSENQMVFGSNPADLFGWDTREEDLFFAQETSLAGRFVQRRNLRVMARKAALKEEANSKLRRLPAYNKSFSRMGIAIGDVAILLGGWPQEHAASARTGEKPGIRGNRGRGEISESVF